jgi:MtN3 and saliva related transmembrane protein
MSHVLVTILGFSAAVLTTGSFFPQVVQTWRTRSAKDLNLFMFLMLTVGIGLWLLYGIFIGSWPVILANAVGVVNASVILSFKIRYG